MKEKLVVQVEARLDASPFPISCEDCSVSADEPWCISHGDPLAERRTRARRPPDANVLINA